MFGQPASQAEARSGPRPGGASAAQSGSSAGQGISTSLGQLQQQQQQQQLLVGTGPFKAMSAKDTAVPPVPLRFISAKSRTSFVAPTSFDPALLARSSKAPAYECNRFHVFGMSSSLNSGSSLFSVPLPPEKSLAIPAAGARGGSTAVRDESSSSRRKTDFIDSSCLVYTAAALGVVHDLTNNTQSFFSEHDDDITCITLSQDSKLVATGQCGKRPYICVWEAMPESAIARSQKRPALTTIGKGFFERAICAVSFTSDAGFIVGIGCDDAHRIGVFDIKSGMLQAEAGCQHGLPPQIRCIKSCPSLQYTEYITKNHRGLCDVFSTVGKLSPM
jgi:WD40 repeat protein